MENTKIRFYNSLNGRMLLFAVLPTVIILFGIIIYSTFNLYSEMRRDVEYSLKILAQHVAAEVEIANARAVMVPKVMALAQESGLFGQRAESSDLVRRVLQTFPEFTGGSFGYEPNADQDDRAYLSSEEAKAVFRGLDGSGRFLPYWFRDAQDNTKLKLEPLVDMEISLYYNGIKELFQKTGRSQYLVTEPYIYEGKMIVEQTYPIVLDGKFKGVATVDRSLKDINEFLADIKTKERVDIFLISSTGRFIAATSTLSKKLITDNYKYTDYRDIIGRFFENNTKVSFELAYDPVDLGDYYFAAAPIETGNWLVVIKKSKSEINEVIWSNIVSTVELALVGLLAVLILSWYVTASNAKRINKVVVAARMVMKGDLSGNIPYQAEKKDEIGLLLDSFRKMVEALQYKMSIINRMSAGDFAFDVEPQGEKDLLGLALHNMVDSLKKVVEHTKNVAGGDFSGRLDPKSDQDELSLALNSMTEALSDAYEKLEQRVMERTRDLQIEHQYKSALHTLAQTMQGEQDIFVLSKKTIGYLAEFLKIPLAAFYIVNQDHNLERMAEFGYPDHPGLATVFKPGEGLIGQAVMGGKPITVPEIPEYARIVFGFGETVPKTVLLYPILYRDRIIGVLELGSFTAFSDSLLNWLDLAVKSIAAAFCTALDIEERKRNAEMLREKEERLTFALEGARLGSWDARLQDGYIDWNPEFARQHGFAEDNLRASREDWFKAINPEDHDLVEGGYNEYLDGQKAELSAEYRTILGHWIMIKGAVAERESDGTARRVTGISIDISERKATEEQLRVAMLEAEAATRAKSDFLANMSHEIRTPMNAIIGMAHLALQTDLTPKQNDYLVKIQGAANSLLGIINDILDFSKIEAGKLDMEQVDFNLDEVMENLANLVTVKAREKENLEVLFATSQDVPRFLKGDPLRLGQVLINLVNNAVKFTSEGEIVISTDLIEAENDHVKLRFTVSDTGVGLTKAQIAKLFTAFSQADTSTTRKYGGTGLGLTISKRLVEMMKGEIGVESQAGRGSRFIFTGVFGRSEKKGKKVFEVNPDLRGMKVLVVDDNPTSREILREMLESFSFKVTLAASGEEGLAEVTGAGQANPFELVIIDWKLPGMDGIEASSRIKNHQSLEKKPVIILVTAYGREEVLKKVEKSCLDGFLLKPVNQSVLFDAIMQSFGQESEEGGGKARQKELEIADLSTIRGARVLLVEDNEINQQVAREILESAGLVVELADNGRKGVRAVREKDFEAVLMDVQMPVMDGYEATLEIRRDERFKDLPVIAMTAHAMASDREKSIESGMNDHVTKPIDPEQLLSILVKWIAPRLKCGPAVSNGAAIGLRPENRVEIPRLEGIDTSTGIKRVGGNRKLYLDLCLKFYRGYQDAAGLIQTALGQEDRELAQRLAHTIKGVAGNLGALDLFEVAQTLETAIQEQEAGTTEKALASFGDELERVLAVLAPLADKEDLGPEKKIAADPENLGRILPGLKNLLADDDSEAVTYLEENWDELRPFVTGSLLSDLKKLVTEYDFETALKVLNQIADQYQVNLEG